MENGRGFFSYRQRARQEKQYQIGHYRAESNWIALHDEAFVGDVHAHPGMKITLFSRKFGTYFQPLIWLLQKLLPFDPLGFNPLRFRTDFESLELGRVNMLMATAVVPEREGLDDINKDANGLHWFWLVFWFVVSHFALGLPWGPINYAWFVIRIPLAVLAVAINVGLAYVINRTHFNPKKYLMFMLSLVSGWRYARTPPWYRDPTQQPSRLRFRLPFRYADYSDATRSMMTLTEQRVSLADRGPYQGKVRFATDHAAYEQALADIDAGTLQTVFVHAIEGAYSLEGEVTYTIIRRARRQTRRGGRLHPSEWDQAPELYHVKDVLLDHDEMEYIQQEVLANLRQFHDMGLAVLGLGHYHPTVIGDVVFPYPEHQLKSENINQNRWPYFFRDITRGLTPIGENVIREALRLGVIVDLNHSSPTTRKDVYELLDAEYPGGRSDVIVSHTAAYALNPLAYCLKDWEIRWLARREGLMGVMLSNYFLTGYADVKLGLRHVARHIDHMRSVIAADPGLGPDVACDAIAIATDFDGFSEPPDDFAFSSQWPRVTQRLMAQYDTDQTGAIVSVFDEDSIKKILGGNLRRVIRSGWGQTQEPQLSSGSANVIDYAIT